MIGVTVRGRDGEGHSSPPASAEKEVIRHSQPVMKSGRRLPMRQEGRVWKPITTTTPWDLSAPYLRSAGLETEAGLHGDRQAGEQS